jgi:hypothetical protein
MVRDILLRPAIGSRTAALPSRLPWLLGPALLGAAAVATASALFPLQALIALPVLVIIACVWKWPALAAYLVIAITPLTAGINRGAALPVLRPHEALAFLVGIALASRGLAQLRTGQLPRLRLGRVELSMLLLAVCSSLLPLWQMTVRQRPISNDDFLYTVVLWKYLGLYALIRMSVRTDRQIWRCLWISVAAASVVAVLAILQSLGLFGVPRILATYYAPFGYTNAFAARGSSTLGLPAATADLMIFNLAIVSGLWVRSRGRRGLLAAAAGLFVLATLSAAEFSSAIGLVVAVVAIAVITNSARLLAVFVPAGVIASQLLQPVFAARFSGFQTVSGLPVSWIGRWENLRAYYLPLLFSHWNLLLGVRPSARIAVASQGTGFVWIESGYVWLLWGGGLPFLAAFVFFVLATAKRGWNAAHDNLGAAGVAGIASFVAITVTAVLMVFDPHLTYRGSADLMFVLIALAATRTRVRQPARAPITAMDLAEEARP